VVEMDVQALSRSRGLHTRTENSSWDRASLCAHVELAAVLRGALVMRGKNYE
jgi:hypothetical protein